jgi:hypothetical protein
MCKEIHYSQAWWCMYAIPATQEVGRKIVSLRPAGQFSQLLSQKQNKKQKAWGIAQVVA